MLSGGLIPEVVNVPTTVQLNGIVNDVGVVFPISPQVPDHPVNV
jgi:hypothetical protein